MLEKYVTTIYDRPSSLLMKFIYLFLSRDNKKRMHSRRNSDLQNSDVLTFCEWSGLLETLLIRLDKSMNLYRRFSHWNANRFGIKVAKYAISHQVDVVICYDSNATSCFRYLKKNAPWIIRIMDVSSTARPYRKTIYEKEIQKSGHDDLFEQNEYMWNDRWMRALQSEIDDTNFFFSPSHFVRDSLINCGARSEQVFIVPYGVNLKIDLNQKEKIKDVVHFLFVGQVNYNKGVPYLLDAFAQLKEDEAQLTIVGGYNSKDWYVEKYKNKRNIKFTGFVTFDLMKRLYEKAHVFVFLSFSEGMTLSGIEAMSCGLPIICTYNSGVSDLVEDGQNGFIVKTGNVSEVADKMNWFVSHPDKIQEMGKAAAIIAKQYTWHRYEEEIVKAISVICDKHKREGQC